jgi:hypothetical protein
MPEILRLQNNKKQHDLKNDLKHWGLSRIYDDKQIDAIESSNKHTFSEPTSIPSPFARIALAKTAFAEVTRYGDNALKSYQKIVSDSLDVAEIFFSFDKWQDRIEILKWDRDVDLKKLEGGHVQLYKTLDTFLKTDAQSYNFDKMKCIYILKYKPTGDMIGATSPCTLFFSSANKFDGEIILGENHKAFDGIFPLHKRSWDFQKYLYTWLAANDETRRIDGRSKSVFYEFKQYLNEQKRLTGKVEEIDNVAQHAFDNIKNYTAFPAGMTVEILGKSYHKQILKKERIESDFEIQASIFTGSIKPLVLPLEGGNGSGYEEWKLTPTTKWTTFKAPVKDAEPSYDQRRLPDGTYYPYLTVSDFLEDTIIRIPHEINTNSFLDAHGKYYLLPLTDLFFEFFSVNDLKTMIELTSSGRTVKITLHIPVKGNKSVEYSRQYNESSGEIKRNIGSVIEKDFAFALFPNVKFVSDNDAHYRFVLISDFDDSDNYKVEFRTSQGLKAPNATVRNENHRLFHKCKNYIIENSNFDYMRIRYGIYSGIIVPTFDKKQGGTNQYTFAVDIGTTNTHIEYFVNAEIKKAKPFDIPEDKGIKQIHRVANIVGEHFLFILNHELIPEYTDDEFKFPARTALEYGETTNWTIGSAPFTMANVATLYEKQLQLPYNKTETDLKWSDDESNKNKLKCYIESLCFMLRNKVVLEDGDLSNTKIVWFYPVSMTLDRFNNFEEIWKNAYKKYFGDNVSKVIPITESVAPYENYKENGNTDLMVSIDIGGGTTDIVIGKDDKVDSITSFRFAANSVFGDGYNENGRIKNGIVRQFVGSISEKVKDKKNGLGNDQPFLTLFEELLNKDSADIVSFLFSLKNNKKIKGKGQELSESVDFSKILRENNSQTIVFLFFYTAIIYHVARIMNAKSMDMPRHITFSGSGSKIIRILSLGSGTLTELTKFIFIKIYGQSEYNPDGLDIIHDANPKEATCKGGLLSQKAEPYPSIHEKKIVLKSSDSRTFILSEKYKDINNDTYINQVVDETKSFIKFVLDDVVTFLASKGFKINNDSYEIAKNVCFKDLKQYIKNGLKRKLKEVKETDIIEETLFFYSLHGMLSALSNAICDKNLKK